MDAVQRANQGTDAADLGLERVVESGTMLHGITDAISQIAHMSTQMAASVPEQQTQVAKSINGPSLASLPVGRSLCG